MLRPLVNGLHSRNGFVRKGSALLLQIPRLSARLTASPHDYEVTPPVLANSFPKSGTHLLDQIVTTLPGTRNYGRFLSSMTGSFRFRLRTIEESCRFVRSSVPGEIVRAHLFHSQDVADALESRHFVHCFIYRDPRDVVLSESHYLRSVNRWHRLHRFFRDAESLDEAVALSIRGLEGRAPGIVYPNIRERFENFAGWIGHPNTFALKFEDLVSPCREEHLGEMIDFYRQRTDADIISEPIFQGMIENIAPERSHTFRSGKAGGWQSSFTDKHRELFKEIAGDTLVMLGYEADLNW